MVDRATAAMMRQVGVTPVTKSGSTDCNIPLSVGIPAVAVGGCKGVGVHTREEYLAKVAQLKEWLDEINPDCLLEVDGGVDAKTHAICKESGANVLVAGSAYFKASDRAAFVKLIQE